MFGIIVAGKRVYDKFAEDEMTVYAAQVSFFIILSVVPFIMLLLTAVQMIPSISNARFMELIVGLVPVDYKSLAFRVVNDLSLKIPGNHDFRHSRHSPVVRGPRHVQRGQGLKPCERPRGKALVCD